MASLKKIDWKITSKIIITLYYSNGIKRTNLATKCNLSYDRFTRYLEWMMLVEFVTITITSEGRFVILTEFGKRLYQKLFNSNSLPEGVF